MRHWCEAAQLRVFLSFAGDDRVPAGRLRQGLEERGIEVFVSPLGGNLVLDISQALADSDYFVLLWSQASVNRPWVNAEWASAFARELAGRRLFLFIVRLDGAPLPALLAPRQYLSAVAENWKDLANDLVSTWRRDCAVGEPVLPAPCPAVARDAVGQGPVIELYVRNRALSVAHPMTVPEKSTGQELMDLVRSSLGLPKEVTKFNGAVGMNFYYQIMKADVAIPLDGKISQLGITDGTIIDLEVQLEPFGPEGSSPRVIYRQGASAGLSPAMTRSLMRSAFGHLIP